VQKKFMGTRVDHSSVTERQTDEEEEEDIYLLRTCYGETGVD